MVDVLSTISSALSIASRLKEISQNISDAEFKNLLADLSLELADAKLKIAGVLEDNAKLREKLLELEGAEGEKCPKCGNRTFEIVSTTKHPSLGDLGIMQREYKCSSCEFAEAKTVKT